MPESYRTRKFNKTKNHISEFTDTKCSHLRGRSHYLHISTNTKTRNGLRGASATDGTERFRKNAQLPQIQIVEQPKNTRDHKNNGNHGACEEKAGRVYWSPNPPPEQPFHQAVIIQRKCTETSWKTSTKNG